MYEWTSEFLAARGLDQTTCAYLSGVVSVLFMVIVSLLAYFITKKLVVKMLRAIIRKSKGKWDNALFQYKVPERLMLIVPALVLHAFAPTFPAGEKWLQRIALCMIVFTFILVLNRVLDAVNAIYKNYEISKFRPIKGYLQVVKIAAYVIGMIIIVSVLINRSAILLLGGIGAATAVLLLIFQDTILGFVASIQLTENDMIRLGDWIEMSEHGANGLVMELSLHTVKVQNWDNTITTIPTYALVSKSFKNWRSMQEAGGRRIERAIYMDLSSIRFCDEELFNRVQRIEYLQEYLTKRIHEIDSYNQTHEIDLSSVVNGRRLTNIGIFRAYVDAYLAHHPKIHKGMTRMVRQLAPTEHGLPLEIYAFTTTTEWEDYEVIQSDIFDHILAVIPQFDLRIFQSPTGHDLKNISIDK